MYVLPYHNEKPMFIHWRSPLSLEFATMQIFLEKNLFT